MNERWEYGDDADAAAAEEARGVSGGHGRFPWPPPEEGPVVGAFGATWKAATFDPAAFFARTPRDRGTGAALLYYMILVLLVAGASLFWDSLSLFTGGMEDSALAAELGIEAVSPIISFLLTPAILLVMLFLSAGITHGLLAIFARATHGFGTTIRVFCYAYSPGLFGVVPFIGGLVGSIWMLVLLIIGLREAHETEGWKAAVAVLLPFVLLLGFMVLMFVMLFAAGAAVLGGSGL